MTIIKIIMRIICILPDHKHRLKSAVTSEQNVFFFFHCFHREKLKFDRMVHLKEIISGQVWRLFLPKHIFMIIAHSFTLWFGQIIVLTSIISYRLHCRHLRAVLTNNPQLQTERPADIHRAVDNVTVLNYCVHVKWTNSWVSYNAIQME